VNLRLSVYFCNLSSMCYNLGDTWPRGLWIICSSGLWSQQMTVVTMIVSHGSAISYLLLPVKTCPSLMWKNHLVNCIYHIVMIEFEWLQQIWGSTLSKHSWDAIFDTVIWIARTPQFTWDWLEYGSQAKDIHPVCITTQSSHSLDQPCRETCCLRHQFWN